MMMMNHKKKGLPKFWVDLIINEVVCNLIEYRSIYSSNYKFLSQLNVENVI